MRTFVVLCLVLTLTFPAARAEEAAPDPFAEGVDLLGEGTRLLLQGLMDRLGPALEDLSEGLEDLNGYHPPEILPNGDILIRRKRGPETLPPPPEGQTDL